MNEHFRYFSNSMIIFITILVWWFSFTLIAYFQQVYFLTICIKSICASFNITAPLFYRNLRAFFALFLLDTSLASNYRTIQIIQLEALSSSIMETFLESAPQSILQCSIILRTGSMCKLILVAAKKNFSSPLSLILELFIKLRLR
jgi:hypothetical protein